jgi:hypothetical protein
MAWIKRNLAIVISGVIALGLLGFGGWYLWTAMEKNSAIDTEIGSAKAELERLMNENPFPSPSNVDQAKKELARMNEFVGAAKKLFPATPPPPAPLNNRSFKELLQTTIDQLNKQASSSGIKITQTNYYFSFESERLPISFAAESLAPMAERLHDVKLLSSLLFDAKINQLESVKRARVAGEAGSGSSAAEDYISETPRTNTDAGMIIWPYEIKFLAFSPELAQSLEGMARTRDAVIVRSVAVEPAEAITKPVAPAPGTPGAKTNKVVGLETVLNEHLLRVIMKVDVIKPGK